jgi:AcrR family transcriptional regulator
MVYSRSELRMIRKSFKREQKLLDAAIEEFSQWSFDEASVNRILKNAHISKGVFYYHFKDKEALYYSVMEIASQAKWEFITSELKDTEIQMGIFEQFRQQAQAGIRFAAQYPKYHQFARMLAKEKNPRIRAHIDAQFVQSDKLNKMIAYAMDNNELSGEYSSSFLTKVIGYLFSHFDDIFPDDRDAYENLNSFIDMMKHGFASKKDTEG